MNNVKAGPAVQEVRACFQLPNVPSRAMECLLVRRYPSVTRPAREVHTTEMSEMTRDPQRKDFQAKKGHPRSAIAVVAFPQAVETEFGDAENVPAAASAPDRPLCDVGEPFRIAAGSLSCRFGFRFLLLRLIRQRRVRYA